MFRDFVARLIPTVYRAACGLACVSTPFPVPAVLCGMYLSSTPSLCFVCLPAPKGLRLSCTRYLWGHVRRGLSASGPWAVFAAVPCRS